MLEAWNGRGTANMSSVKPAVCAHCGLPVFSSSDKGPAYCCTGCAIVAAMLGAAQPGERVELRQSRGLLLRLGLAAFFSANVMLLSIFLYTGEAPPLAVKLVDSLLLVLSAPVFVLLAPPFLAGMARDLRRRRPSTDSLIAIGTAAALVYSAISVFRGSTAVYFDTATMVLMLVTAGKLLESNARLKGRRAVEELIVAQPTTVRVWRDGGWHEAAAAQVQRGETVRVLAGERIPVDGRIVHGAAAVDESMLTGEPLPAERETGGAVRAGTLCLNGVLEIEASGDSSQTLLARIIASVEEAQRLRSPLERLADKVAAAFVPAVIALAGIVALQSAWLNGLAVLVVACPCAMGIAVPLANVLALAAAAREGVLVRSSEALERLALTDTIVFDKTGTLTRGEAEVKHVAPVPGEDQRTLLAAAATAAADSLHPVARAVLRRAERDGVQPWPRRRVEVLPGRGVEVESEAGATFVLGQPRWIESRVGSVPEGWQAEMNARLNSAHGVVWCAADGRLMGGLWLDDPVSDEARECVAACQRLGLRLHVLSGDGQVSVGRAAAALSIPSAEGGLLPEEKAGRIRAWRAAGQRVAMVGDGINDAPALAAAGVGIAVSNGTEVTREVAEIVFLESGLWRLPRLIQLARRTRRIARQNLGWAFGYNLIGVGLAAGGKLRPVLAAVLMLASSLLVTANSLRVGRLTDRARGLQ
jgi:Cu2+-exporting ATPase